MNNKEHIQQYIDECCNDLNRLLSKAYETDNPLDYIERYAYGTNFRRSALEMMNEVDVEGQRLRFKDVVTNNKTDNNPKQQKPLSEGVPELPNGYVYLGKGGEFRRLGTNDDPGLFTGAGYVLNIDDGWDDADTWEGIDDECHYAAPADSEIAKLNGLA